MLSIVIHGYTHRAAARKIDGKILSYFLSHLYQKDDACGRITSSKEENA